MVESEVTINRELLKAFIAYNRSYDDIAAKIPDIESNQDYAGLGDALETLALEELITGYPQAETNRELAKTIMFDILDAEPLQDLTPEELAIEYLNFFAGEFEARTAG